MTEHKFTDEEIKKALECCFVNRSCKGCPQYAKDNCIVQAGVKALDLINRQQAEIESLNEQERILIYHLAFEREKAIKEFADELCKGRVSNDPVVIAVQAELNMMNGETKTDTDFPKDYSYGY